MEKPLDKRVIKVPLKLQPTPSPPKRTRRSAKDKPQTAAKEIPTAPKGLFSSASNDSSTHTPSEGSLTKRKMSNKSSSQSSSSQYASQPKDSIKASSSSKRTHHSTPIQSSSSVSTPEPKESKSSSSSKRSHHSTPVQSSSSVSTPEPKESKSSSSSKRTHSTLLQSSSSVCSPKPKEKKSSSNRQAPKPTSVTPLKSKNQGGSSKGKEIKVVPLTKSHGKVSGDNKASSNRQLFEDTSSEDDSSDEETDKENNQLSSVNSSAVDISATDEESKIGSPLPRSPDLESTFSPLATSSRSTSRSPVPLNVPSNEESTTVALKPSRMKPWEVHQPMSEQEKSWTLSCMHEYLRNMQGQGASAGSRGGERGAHRFIPRPPNRPEGDETTIDEAEQWLSVFPIGNDMDLAETESRLKKDAAFRSKLHNELKSVGGATMDDMVFAAMYYLMTCEFAKDYTFEGRNGKNSFKDLRLSYALKVAVKEKFPSADNVVIGKRAGRWLTTAKNPKTQKKRRRSQFEMADFEADVSKEY